MTTMRTLLSSETVHHISSAPPSPSLQSTASPSNEPIVSVCPPVPLRLPWPLPETLKRDCTWLAWKTAYSEGSFRHFTAPPDLPYEILPADYDYLRPPIHPKETDRRHTLYRYRILKTTLPRNAFDHLTSLTKRLFDCPMCIISLVDDDYQWFVSEQGLGCSSTTRGVSFCGHSILNTPNDLKEPMVVLDASKDWRFCLNPVVTGPPNVHFYAGANLVDFDSGLPLGTLCILDSRPWAHFPEASRRLLVDLADVVVRELRLWREERWAEVKNNMQKTVAEFTELTVAAKNSPTEEDGFELAVKMIRNTLGADVCALVRCSEREESDNSNPEDCLAISKQEGDGKFENIFEMSEKVIPPNYDSEVETSSKEHTNAEREPWNIRFLDTVISQINATDGVIWQDNFKEAMIEDIPSVLGALNGTGACSGIAVPVYRVLGEKQYTVGGAVAAVHTEQRPFAILGVWWTDKRRIVEEMDRQFLQNFATSLTALAQRGRVEMANKSKSSFVNSISHELRTPLHGILAVVELLEDTRLTSAQRQFLRTITSCGKNLVSVVNHVLDLAKIEYGRMEVMRQPKPVDLWDVCQEVCDSLAATVKDGIRFGMRVIGGWRSGRWCSTDPGCLRQILLNLIGNALKFTKSGYVELHLTIPEVDYQHLDYNETNIMLQVVDTGPGMSEQFQLKLCQPFSQENSLNGGTGLGLAITRYLVQAMNGEFRVQSTLGKGSKFEILIPVKLINPESLASHKVELENVDMHSVVEQCSYLSQHLSGKLVAVIRHDDDQELVNSVVSYLSEFTGAKLVHMTPQEFETWVDPGVFELLVVDDSVPALKKAVQFNDGRPRPKVLSMISIAGEFEKASEFMENFKKRYFTRIINPEVAINNPAVLLAKPVGPMRFVDGLLNLYRPQKGMREMVGYSHETKYSNVSTQTDVTVHEISVGNTPIMISIQQGAVYTPQTNERREFSLGIQHSVPVIRRPSVANSEITSPLPTPHERAVLEEPAALVVKKEITMPKVLIVEDNRINQDILAAFLNRIKVPYDTACDGLEAVEAYQCERYDVILMDIQMPRMDGNQATIEIRRLERERDEKNVAATVIWALTGLASKADEQLILSSGVNSIITKPVSLKRLGLKFEELWPGLLPAKKK